MTTFGKSVVSFAEVGYQRLGTLATRVSEEDFAAYTALVSHLCDTCQVSVSADGGLCIIFHVLYH